MTEGVCTRATREMLKYIQAKRFEEGGCWYNSCELVYTIIEKAINDEDSDWLSALHQPMVLELVRTYANGGVPMIQNIKNTGNTWEVMRNEQ